MRCSIAVVCVLLGAFPETQAESRLLKHALSPHPSVCFRQSRDGCPHSGITHRHWTALAPRKCRESSETPSQRQFLHHKHSTRGRLPFSPTPLPWGIPEIRSESWRAARGLQ